MYKYLQVLCASPWRSGSKSIQDWPKIFIFSSFPFLSLGRTSTTVTEKQKKNLFLSMYLYQHFKNRAVSITSDFPPHIIALIAPSQLPLNWNFLFHYFATVLTLYKLEVTSIYMLRKWLDCWTQGLLIARQILVFSAFNKTQHLPELWQDYSVVNCWVYSAGSQSKLQNKKINK